MAYFETINLVQGDTKPQLNFTLRDSATAIVTNPVLLAIAFGYEETDPAPYILAKGKNYAADLIIKEAKNFDIPIMRNIDLAHELFEKGKIFDFIPDRI